MNYKQKTYTNRTWNPFTREWVYYEVPTPEYVPDYSGIIAGAKSLTAFVLIGCLIFRGLGVM